MHKNTRKVLNRIDKKSTKKIIDKFTYIPSKQKQKEKRELRQKLQVKLSLLPHSQQFLLRLYYLPHSTSMAFLLRPPGLLSSSWKEEDTM